MALLYFFKLLLFLLFSVLNSIERETELVSFVWRRRYTSVPEFLDDDVQEIRGTGTCIHLYGSVYSTVYIYSSTVLLK